MPSGCVQHRILVEDEWPRVIGFDEPLGERLVAHLVESPEHDDNVGERQLPQGGELGERRQPGHGRIRRPPDDIVGEQGAQINRCAADLGLERLQQHVLARFTHRDPLVPSLSTCWTSSGNPTCVQDPRTFALASANSSSVSAPDVVQLCEVLDLVSRVRRRRRSLRFLLVVVGRRLVVGLLLLVALLGLVVSDRRSSHQRPAPRPSPESHENPFPFVRPTRTRPR